MLGMRMMFPIKGICINSLLAVFLCPLDTPSDPYKTSKMLQSHDASNYLDAPPYYFFTWKIQKSPLFADKIGLSDSTALSITLNPSYRFLPLCPKPLMKSSGFLLSEVKFLLINRQTQYQTRGKPVS